MTDNEIIKALECCKKSADCKKCPLSEYSLMAVECMGKLIAESNDLIQRQQERIERLKDNLDVVLKERADHSEAIEEFADRIVEQLEEASYDSMHLDMSRPMTETWQIVDLDDAIAIVKGVQNEDL